MARILSCRLRWLAILLLSFCTVVSPGRAGDHPDYTYRSNASEVRLTFSVVDQNDHGIATLQASDFAIVDKDFIVRNFQSFTRSDWTKLEIGILLDSSESVTPQFRCEMADAIDLIEQTAGVPDENLAMFSFDGHKPELLCAADCRASGAAQQLSTARPGGLTPLFDTVVFASDFLAQHSDAQTEKVLIVLSDGQDTISRSSLRDAIDAAMYDDIQIDSIDLKSSANFAQGQAVLRHLASATGGRFFAPATGVTHAVNAILEGFRASYTVSYQLPTHGLGFHAVHILPTHNLNLQFRSRSGYYYPNYTR
jgi:VWFA-related protein